MSEKLDKVLEKIKESLTTISGLSHTINTHTRTFIEKYNKLESKIHTSIDSTYDERITSLELQIKLMEESINTLKTQHDENIIRINELASKVGKKRHRWQVI